MEWRLILFALVTLFALTCGHETMVGGSKDVNIEDDDRAQKALKAAVEEHNKRRNCMYLTKVQEVKKAEVQVVEGLLYKITVVMARTPCRKDGNPEMCPFFEDQSKAKPYECTFHVWSRPWLENHTLVYEECSP